MTQNSKDENKWKELAIALSETVALLGHAINLSLDGDGNGVVLYLEHYTCDITAEESDETSEIIFRLDNGYETYAVDVPNSGKALEIFGTSIEGTDFINLKDLARFNRELRGEIENAREIRATHLKQAELRESAIAKLTPEERDAIGL